MSSLKTCTFVWPVASLLLYWYRDFVSAVSKEVEDTGKEKTHKVFSVHLCCLSLNREIDNCIVK